MHFCQPWGKRVKIHLCRCVFPLPVKIGCQGYGFLQSDLAVGGAALYPVPFIAHQPGLPEQPVHLPGVPAAPEGQDGSERHVGFAVRLPFRDGAIPQALEFSALGGSRRHTDNGSV